jgi:hypothetical protein
MIFLPRICETFTILLLSSLGFIYLKYGANCDDSNLWLIFILSTCEFVSHLATTFLTIKLIFKSHLFSYPQILSQFSEVEAYWIYYITVILSESMYQNANFDFEVKHFFNANNCPSLNFCKILKVSPNSKFIP